MNQSSIPSSTTANNNSNTPLTLLMMQQPQPHHQQQQHQLEYDGNSNGFESFLDIFSTDMDFEQAYSMYNTLQQKSAIGSFEELNKVQMLNSQYTTNLPTPPPHQPQHQQHYSSVSSDLPHDEFAASRQQILNGGHQYTQEHQHQQEEEQQQQQQQQQQEQEGEDDENDDFDHFFTNTESNALEKFLDSLTNPKATVDPLQFYQNNNSNHHHNNSRSPQSKHKTTTNDSAGIDFDFEMRTMSIPSFKQNQHLQHLQQLQQRLHFQVFQPQLHQPQPFYPIDSNFNNSSSSPNQTIHSNVMQQAPPQHQHLHLQQQQQQPQVQDHLALRNELAEAFSVPAKSPFSSPPLEKQVEEAKKQATATSTSKKNSSKQPKKDSNKKKTVVKQETKSTTQTKQLITPPTSGDESKKRQGAPEEEEEEEEEYDSDDQNNTTTTNTSSSPKRQLKKRRRSSSKPLLSLQQKRLNHSHSEQKRRQLCKQAYQRCLEQIIDLDAFAKLPELNEADRKTKRARVNKEGLPNLSKHSALMRISNEMILIKLLNDGLKQLLG